MGTNFGGEAPQEPEVVADINTTPLIDVMLVLLIMLIITIPAQQHSINLNMPVSAANSAVLPLVIRIEVNARNEILWNKQKLNSQAELEQHLQAVARQQPQPELHLQADPRAKYGTVAGIMAASQRHGLAKLGILDSEESAPDSSDR